VRQEVTERYARSTASLAEDLRPTMELLDEEIQALGDAFQHQINNLRRKLARAYRNSPYTKEMEDTYRTIEKHLASMYRSNEKYVEAVGQTVRTLLDDVSGYPMEEKYLQTVGHVLQHFEEYVDSTKNSLTQAVHYIDSHLLTMHNLTSTMYTVVADAVNDVKSNPTLMYVQHKLKIEPYFETAANKIKSMRMPETFNHIISSASSNLNRAIADITKTKSLKHVGKAYNEVYQQGVWAYNYWEVEENLRKHLLSIAELLEEIVQEEVELYLRRFDFLQKSHVTVWSPEQGEVQAELHLPVPMKTLTEMPNLTPLFIDTVVPIHDNALYFYDNYVPEMSWWGNDSVVKNKVPTGADHSENSPKYVPNVPGRQRPGTRVM